MQVTIRRARLVVAVVSLSACSGHSIEATNGVKNQPPGLEPCEGGTYEGASPLPGDSANAGMYTLTVTNQAGSCSSGGSLLRGEKGQTGEKGDPGTYDIAGGGLVLDGDALSVDPAFVLQTIEDAKPSIYTLAVTPGDFVPSLPGSGYWRIWEGQMGRLDGVSSDRAFAMLKLPEGAVLAGPIKCNGKGTGTHAFEVTLNYVTASNRFPCGAAVAFPTGAGGGAVDVPVPAACQTPVNHDTTTSAMRLYSIAIETAGDFNDHFFRRCRVQYSLP